MECGRRDKSKGKEIPWMERPPSATEEKLLAGMTDLSKALEQQGTLLAEIKAETGTVKESVKDIEACRGYCEGLAEQLEEKFRARDARDALIVTALEQIDEYVQGILAKMTLPVRAASGAKPKAKLSPSTSPVMSPAVHAADGDESADSPWQKTLLQLVGKAMEANLLQDRLHREFGDGGHHPASQPYGASLPFPPEDAGRAERSELENLKLKEKLVKLELQLAAALVDKNLAGHLVQQDIPPNPSKSFSNKVRNPKHTEFEVVPGDDESQPRAPRSITGISLKSAASARSVGARSHISSISGGTTSATTCRYLDEAPQRAFVINVRRLINVQKILHLLHILVNSTAIAALTLVQAGTTFQLYSTFCFLTCVVVLFAIHDTSWDRIDISDMTALLPLLSDDHEDGTEVHNPNRMLKAMSVHSLRIWWWIWWIMHFIGFFCCLLSWIILSRYWSFAYKEQPDDDESHGLFWDRWAENIAKNTDDGAIIGMQIMVGTVMFVLHLLFEWIHQREMGAIMPSTTKEAVWDPRKDGVPFKYQWFGLPSMWFTSNTTCRDLYHWIDKAHPTKNVSLIYPEELALYALSGEAHRHFLKDALKEAKLFDGIRRKYIKMGDNPEPQSLAIELCFFDQQHSVKKDCKFHGEFLELGDAGMKSRRSQVADIISTLQNISDEVILKRSKSMDPPPNPCAVLPSGSGRNVYM